MTTDIDLRITPPVGREAASSEALDHCTAATGVTRVPVAAEDLERLFVWFAKFGREFPWRATADAFAVLIAEIMLQRTTPSHVAPVFQQIATAFPTARELAGAEPSIVDQMLRPLGLNKRSRLLRHLSVELVEKWGGSPPTEYDQLLSLPGVGPYTARAVLCLAHGRDIGMPDVNVIRVASRAFGVSSRRRRPHIDRDLWRQIDALIPMQRAREFNLGLIDLGAMVCRKRDPKCSECPLWDCCIYRKGEASSA